MPGHKQTPIAGGLLPLGQDITEIADFDNLHQPEGILKEGMQRAAQLYGSDASFYLVNGSTGGILAGICAATKPNDTILMPRGCHKSVYHGVELRQLTPIYLNCQWDTDLDIAGSVSPQEVEQKLDQNPHVALVLITSPTYEGVNSDLTTIAQICHSRGVPLMVDQAHGSHLGFCPQFGGAAVTAGADIVIHSLHKTLPSPTQTGLAHWKNNGFVSGQEFARQLAIFQTSSPSYLLMAGIEDCLALLQQQGDSLFRQYVRRLQGFSQQVQGLQKLSVLGYGKDSLAHHPAIFSFDRGKLVISTRHTNCTGSQLKQILRQQYHIELEMAMGQYALAMTSVFDTDASLRQLAQALLAIDANLQVQPNGFGVGHLPLPRQAMPPWKARLCPSTQLALPQAQGRIAAQSIWAYPPGIPLVTAGEYLDLPLLQQLLQLQKQGVELYQEGKLFTQKIAVLQSEKEPCLAPKETIDIL